VQFVSRSYPVVPTCVYRLYDAEGSLLYVGVASDLEVRFKDHAKEKAWWPLVARREITWFDSRLDAMYEESRAIGRESPIHNKRPGIHPIGLMVQRRARTEYRHWHDSDGDLVVSSFGKAYIMRDVAANVADAVVAIDGQARGVIMGLNEYKAACAALGVEPQCSATALVIDVEDLVG
jgi:predicted GIY-YIG superfamily endonuclease